MKATPYLFLVVALALSPHAANANICPVNAISKNKLGTDQRVYIHYAKGLLNARLTGATLGQVLCQLGMETGARFIVIDPATGAQPVFAKVAALPFTKGIKRILDGFSYVIYPVEGSPMPAVTVLSMPRAHEPRPGASNTIAEQSSAAFYSLDHTSFPPQSAVPRLSDEIYPDAMSYETSQSQVEGPR